MMTIMAVALLQAAVVQAGSWQGDTAPSADGIRRLGFARGEGESHYILFMTCQAGSGWVSVTQSGPARSDGAMHVSIAGMSLTPISRRSQHGPMGPEITTMLPANHPVFVSMMRGSSLTINAATYPVTTLVEQRRVASFTETCDETEL
jgi:hypothetical protein